jgi:hypothetical protein
MTGEINYSLFLNKLTPDPNDYAARVVDVKTYTLDDVVEIVTRDGKTQTEEEARSVYLGFEKALVEIISKGVNVHLPMFNTAFTISGVFDHDEENFTEGKHKLNLKIYPSDLLVKAAKKNRLKRVKATEYSPEPIKLEDIRSKTLNDRLTPGNMACLKGEKLQINTELADEGVYLINEKGKEFKVVDLGRNMPGEILFLIPAGLAAGSYWVEVRNRSYQTLSTGRLKHQLGVR